MASRLPLIGRRVLGVGLASGLSVVTLTLGFTGRLTLYISPESVIYACLAAVVVLIGAVWSCTIPLGEEEHSHGDEEAPSKLSALATVSGGVIATAVVAAGLIWPPASLSAQLAMSRADTSAALFVGADTPTLGVADTATFGVGEWASVFATATRPEAYDGATVVLTGFVTPGEDGSANLTRLVITHCVIDAQPASVPVKDAADYEVGQWIEVTGTVVAGENGTLLIVPDSVVEVSEPGDPYEY